MNELDLRQSIKRIEYSQRLNNDLLNSFRNQIDWLFDFCDRHKISIPLHDLEKFCIELPAMYWTNHQENPTTAYSLLKTSHPTKSTEPVLAIFN
jgi:hypothetical protein